MSGNSVYESELTLTKENMKFETLLLVGEFENDYSLSKDQVKLIIQMMYEIIEGYTIESWNMFAMYLDRTFESVCPEIFECCV